MRSLSEIQGHLEEIYGTEVSPQLISTVTDAVTAAVAEWQSRSLEPLYPVMFFDAIRVKVRDQGMVSNKAVYWLWASPRMAASTSWGYGSTPTKVPSFGCGSSTRCAPAGSATS